MKINKVTALVCAVMVALSGIAAALLNNPTVQNIFYGIFTGFIVSFVTSITGYFHERENILNKIESNLKALYVDMLVLTRAVGNMLALIRNASLMERLGFENITSLSNLTIDYVEQVGLGSFSSFSGRGTRAEVVMRLRDFTQTCYAIKNIAADLQTLALTFDNESLEIEQKRMQGLSPSPVQLQEVENLRDRILVETAKFHEFMTGQTVELEKIAKLYFGDRDGERSWEVIKPVLMKRADDILGVSA